MLVKILLAFLGAMAVLAFVGRLRFPGPRRGDAQVAVRCEGCGRYLIGGGTCDCGAPPSRRG